MNGLYSALLIQTWYAALHLHLAEHGHVTEDDRIAILARVRLQVREMESFLETQENQPFTTRDLMKQFEKIALLSARAPHPESRERNSR
jgi:hypothetical protein